jgi:alpha-tubulin suppressor-like RCC1 family protein
VLSGKTLIQISAGEDWTCALANTGAAYCWGNNSIASGGQADLGNNLTNTASPQAVLVYNTGTTLIFTQISVGADFACGLTSAGVAYCWGNNAKSQLGNGGTSASIAPGLVTATSGTALYQLTLTQIDAGTSYACALASTGAAYCWGLGTSGQLGNSASTTSSTAVAVTVGGSSLIPSGTTLIEITTGGTSTCALGSAGAAYCWGAGGSGQLGNGSTTAIQNTAVAVTATSTGMPLTEITAGTSFACAVDVTGAAYCWGADGSDQMGNAAAANPQLTPLAVTATGVLAGASLFQISSGQLATCAQDTTGAFYCWGGNGSGQLGNGTTGVTTTPVSVGAIVPGAPTSVAAFPASTTATVYWATPASLGTGTLTGYIATASPSGTTCNTTTALTCTISGLTNGTTYTVTVATDTTDGNSANSTAATVTPWPPATQIAAGFTHACVLSAGLAYCWGDNTYGQLGNNSTTSSATPVAVYTGSVLSGVTLTKIASGQYYTCALSSAGNVYCWGADNFGQLGNNTTATSFDVPVAVYTTGTPMASPVTISQIAVGQVSVCALSTAGLAYCWGASPDGQLGNGSSGGNVPYPVAVTTSELPAGVVWVQLSSAGSNSCALASNGTAFCWGFNAHGQVGDNNSGANVLIPTAVTVGSTGGIPTGTTLTQVTNGYDFACGLSSTGAAYCWGLNSNDQLGNTSAANPSIEPVAVTTSGVLSGVTLTQLSGGDDHVCALSTAGAGYCWGDDTYGQLGNNSTSGNDDAPVAAYTSGLLSGITLSQVSSGAYFTCVLDTNSYAYCWGANNDTAFDVNTGSQLGNDSTTQSPVAVYVGPQAPTGVGATAGNTTATVSWTAPVYLNNATLTGYTASSTPGTVTCSTAAGTTTCGLTGLTDGTTYTVTVIDTTSASSSNTSAPSSPPVTVEPVGLSLTGPSSLTWAVTGTGVNQSTVDANSGDQQFTVGDTLTAGWNVVVSATTFTAGTHTLPNTAGTFNFTGSLSSSLATTAPTATCVGSCTLPTDATTYPVNIITAASSPTLYKVYDTPASTGEGVMTIGVNGDANPIGWWVQMPASGYTGTYTSTVTLELVSGP